MDEEFKRAYAEAYPDRVREYVADRWSHVCTDGNVYWCKHDTFCGVCRKEEDDNLGHHGPKDRDRVGPGAVPRTTADTIRSLKPGDRVRVVHEVVVVVGPDYDGDVLVEDDYYLIHDDPTITSVEVIERPLQVGDRVLNENGRFGNIQAIWSEFAWVVWVGNHAPSTVPFSDLRRAS